jgi:hypothetical protein
LQAGSIEPCTTVQCASVEGHGLMFLTFHGALCCDAGFGAS